MDKGGRHLALTEHREEDRLHWSRAVQVRIFLSFARPPSVTLTDLMLISASTVYPSSHRPYGLPTPYRRYFSRFVSIVASYQGRPHWAKAHTLTPPELRTLYPEFDRFVALVQANDPDGMFRNEYVRRHLLGEKSEDVEDGVFRSSGRRGQ